MPKFKKVFPILGIYKITSPTNKIYIGKSTNIKKRWNAYKNIRCKHQKILYNSLSKYGHENHKFEIIHTLPLNTTQQELSELEIFYINKHINEGCYMMNLQFANNIVMQPIEDIDILKERVDDILYTIMNINDSSKVETSNLFKFYKEYRIYKNLKNNLISTYYGYLEDGRPINSCKDWKIISQKSLVSEQEDEILHIKLEEETNRRKILNTNYKPKEINKEGWSEVYVYKILNTNTNEILHITNLTKFCIDNNMKCRKRFQDTIYGLTRDGKYAKEYKNFKILHKTYLNETRDDTKLQNRIEEETRYRLNKRTESGRCDKSSDGNKTKHSVINQKFIYNILNTKTGDVTKTTDIYGFMRIHIGNTSSAIHHTLYGYNYLGNEYNKYKGFKIISKHYINKDLDDEKLQQEIQQEIIRRKSIMNK